MANAASSKAIARNADQAKRDAVTDKIVVNSLMSTPDGRRWVWLHLSKCHVFRQTFDPGPGGNARMCFAEGRRSLGLEMLALVTSNNPGEYTQMVRENSGTTLEEPEDD